MSRDPDKEATQEIAAAPPPKGRWRRGRLLKRVATVALPVLLILIGTVAIVVQSDWFWRGTVLERALGPDYADHLSIRTIRPALFPPTLELEGISLKDAIPDVPGAPPVLSADRVLVSLSWKSRPSRIVIKRLETDGLTIAVRKDAQDRNSFADSLAALLASKPIDASAAPEMDGLPGLYIEESALNGVHFRFRHDGIVGGLVFTYRSLEPIVLSSPDSPDATVDAPPAEIGRVDKLLRVQTRGTMTLRGMGVDFTHEARGSLDIRELRNFPGNDMAAALELFDGADVLLTASADMPLRRAVTRPKGIPFEKMRLRIPAADSPNAVEIRDFYFDPIAGRMEGLISADARPRELADVITRLVVPEKRAAFLERVDAFAASTRLLRDRSRIFVEWRIAGQGIGAYAAEQPGESPPFRIDSNFRVTLSDLPLGALGGGGRGEGGLPARLSLELQTFADEKTELGNIRATLYATRDDITVTDPLFSLTLAKETDPTKGVELRPFEFGAMRRVLDRVAVPPRRVPPNIKFANYDRLTATIGRLLSLGSEFLRVLSVEDAALRFKMDLNDQNLVNDIVAPVLGRTLDDGKTTLDVEVLFRGADRTNEVNAELSMDDIRFPELDHPIRVSGRGSFLQDLSRITATDLRAGIAIDRDGGLTSDGREFDLELALSRGGPDGEFGPPAPTYIDFSTGRGHFELQLESLSREMIEVLLQIQTFDLSETLAQPLYDRILDLLGMSPGSRGSVARARAYLVGTLGETHRIHSVIQILDLAPGAFLRLPGGSTDTVHQRIDIRWEQMFALDRVKDEVAADVFDLRLLDKRSDVLMSLVLEGTLPAVFDMPTVEAGAAKQLEDLANSRGPAEGISGLLRPALENLALARRASRTAGARLVFDIPRVELATWQETLERSGVPIRGGTLNVRAAAELNSGTLAHDLTSLAGEFHADDILFGRAMKPLPEFAGRIEFAQSGTTLELRDFETSATLDPAFPPVRVKASASADATSGEGRTHLLIDGLNSSVIDRLAEVKAAGIGAATDVLERVPLGRLQEIAGRDAEIGLEFDARTREFGRATKFEMRQWGRDLRVLPTLFSPLSFDIEERGDYDTSGTLVVEGLSGGIREAGVSEPILTLATSAPFAVSRNGGRQTGPAEVRLGGRKDLAALSPRLREALMPFVGRTIEGGFAEFEFKALIPAGGLAVDLGALEIENAFSAAVRSVRLSDFPAPIDMSLAGRLRKSASTVALGDVKFLATVDGVRGGEIALDAQLDTASSRYDGTLALTDWNRRLLDVLPRRFNQWLAGEEPRFDAELRTSGVISSLKNESVLRARMRHLPVPPLDVPGRAERWTHPPLLAGIDVAFELDGETSTVLTRELRAVLGTEPREDGGSVLPDPQDTLLSAKLRGPARLPLTREAESRGGDDLGRLELAIDSGPIDLRRYAPVLAAVAGIPVTDGFAEAHALVRASGIPENLRSEISFEGNLTKVRWPVSDADVRDLGAEFRGAATATMDRVEVRDLVLLLKHPNSEDKEDDLTLSGEVRLTSPRHAELHMKSDGIAIDRVLELASTVREPSMPASRNAPPGPKDETPVAPGLRIPRDVTGLLTLEAKELLFRKLHFPNAEIAARLADGVVTVDKFRVDAEEGRLELSARADLGGDSPTFDTNARIEGLSATPWVDSFAPALAGRVKGKLEATLEARGEGATAEELSRSLFARIAARVSEGHFQGTPLKAVFGDLGRIEARLNAVADGDRVTFSADTPRDDTKDIRISGVIRNAIPRKGVLPWVSALADVALTRARTSRPRELRDGVELHPRARGLGVRVRLDGLVGEGKSPAVSVESLYN